LLLVAISVAFADAMCALASDRLFILPVTLGTLFTFLRGDRAGRLWNEGREKSGGSSVANEASCCDEPLLFLCEKMGWCMMHPDAKSTVPPYTCA
jgi:hypothetical protein